MFQRKPTRRNVKHRSSLTSQIQNRQTKEKLRSKPDAGLDFYMMARGIMQGVINIFTAGLYHLFEQQLLCIHRTALLNHVSRSP